MTDGIIDIRRYLHESAEPEEGRSKFALWGADGERARFALPLWRIVSLAKGERGGIVSRKVDGSTALKALVVLDLARDPARVDFDALGGGLAGGHVEPRLDDLGGDGVVVRLGVHGDYFWTLRVEGNGRGREALSPKIREDILFLAGECAGLLFLRGLADYGG